MKDPFCYIPPTPETAPKIAAIRNATTAADEAIAAALFDFDVNKADRVACFDAINAATKAMHDTIEAMCPPSADTSAALRCCRLARMAANEAIVSPVHFERARRLTFDQLLLARWQACAAVALADEVK